MAGKKKGTEGTSAKPKRGEETHKPSRSSEGGRHTPDSTHEASGAELREQLAQPTIASVTTMVCLTCGAEQFFEGAVPSGLKCARCGSMVFRIFDTPTVRDEATIAHLEEEARSIQYGDPSPQISPDELKDLQMG
jgi:DNA-directed RNA polymerase subunit RPC12/RpoP